MTIEIFGDILLDSFLDSLKILPLIFIIYVLIELIESKSSANGKLKRLLSSKYAPVFGATIGIIPQCGFSVVATGLYKEGYVMLGTLIAVYFATSDEAIPILFSQAFQTPSLWLKIVLLISIKVVYAATVGFIINALVKNKATVQTENVRVSDETVIEEGCCHHDVTKERNTFKTFIVHPLLHSLKIFIYVFVINLIFGVILGFIGESALRDFLNANLYLQPLLSTVIGIIPNCASSVLITQMFAQNALSLGGAIAGLTINSGLGLAVLLKDKSNVKSSLKIVALMVILSLFIGYAVTFISMLF